MARHSAVAARYKGDIEDVPEVTRTNRGPFGLLEADNTLEGPIGVHLELLEADRSKRTG